MVDKNSANKFFSKTALALKQKAAEEEKLSIGNSLSHMDDYEVAQFNEYKAENSIIDEISEQNMLNPIVCMNLHDDIDQGHDF